MNAADFTREDQEIDQLLADMDGTIIASNVAESTVGKLRSELATLELALQQPASPDPYQNESACVRAVELVAAMGRDAESGSAKRPVTARQELGELGPYQLLDWLGQGGMGTVYKALHSRLDKLVAIKVLPAERLKSEDALGRFQREMKAVGKVDHPHLVRALDAGETNGTHYLVMEFVSGTDLGALLKQRGPLPVADACELIVQAAKGLQAAHSRGMVHRDIKPANLMLAVQEFGPPVVKVLDLGLALLADAHDATSDGLTSDSQIMGTIDYMAPEQAENSHSVDVRADVYSLGATLYALLTGGSIFADRPNQSLIQKLSALANEPAAPIRSRCDAVSEPLAKIVHRMLSRKPGDRFASMAEVIAALQPFVAGANLSGLLAESGDPESVVPQAATLCVTEPISTVPLVTHPASGSGTGRAIRVAVAAVAGVVLLGAILLSIRNPNGDVIVEIPDDLPAEVRKEIKISVTGDGAAEVASEANGWKVGIKEGKYSVELTGGKDRVQIEDKQVTVSRNKKSIVTITTKPLGAMAAGPIDPDRSAAEWLRSIGSGAEIGVMIDGNFNWVLANEPLPAQPFLVRNVTFIGPGIDQLGDRLADEVANRMKGVRINLDLVVFSKTLTTTGFGKIVRLPESAEAIGVRLDCSGLGDGIFPHLAQLPNLARMELIASPMASSPGLSGKGMSALKACPRLTEMSWINGSPSGEGVEELLQVPQLKSLRFNAVNGTEPLTMALAKLSLNDLKLHASKIDDAMVRHLAAMRTLEWLDITHNPITDTGLAELKSIKTLKALFLQGTKVTATGIADLQQALPNCKIEWDAPADPDRKLAEWLRSFDPPISFDVYLNNSQHVHVGGEQTLPTVPFRLFHMDLVGAAIDQRGDAFLEELATRLRGVRLQGIQINSQAVSSSTIVRLLSQPALVDLETLALNNKTVDDETVAALAQLKKFTGFNVVFSPKLTGKGIGQLRSLNSLTVLYCPAFSVEAIEELQHTPLNALNIIGLPFTQRHFDTIAKLKLKQFIADDGDVDDAMLAPLAEMVTAENILLRNNPITDKGLQAFKNLKHLTRLGVNQTKVTAAGVADLQQALPNCKIEWDGPKP